MNLKIHYLAFYDSASGAYPGQVNLSRPLRHILADSFELVDLSPKVEGSDPEFPPLWKIIGGMHRIVASRIWRRKQPGSVTVVDMVHSLACLPKARVHDKIIIVGHDSYSLRARRELAAQHLLGPRLRLLLSTIGWMYAEFLLRRIAWRSFFVSPLDRLNAARRSSSGLIAIPVDASLRARGASLRNLNRKPSSRRLRLLVSLPVRNLAQARIDRDLTARVVRLAGDRAEITLWGKGAAAVGCYLDMPSIKIVDWVEDYPGFLESFDLLIYPRMIGSGFHTKLAEALVLGVPCVCAEWVAAALASAGYNGLATFSGPEDFECTLRSIIDSFCNGLPLPAPTLPTKAAPDAALLSLRESCAEAGMPTTRRDCA